MKIRGGWRPATTVDEPRDGEPRLEVMIDVGVAGHGPARLLMMVMIRLLLASTVVRHEDAAAVITGWIPIVVVRIGEIGQGIVGVVTAVGAR